MSENSDLDLEFVSPFPLLNCVQRLEGRHEKVNMSSWLWKRRLAVKVWKIQEGLYGFMLKDAGTDHYIIMSGSSVDGYLRAINPNETAVQAQRHIHYLMISLLALVIGVTIGVAFSVNPGHAYRVSVGIAAGLLTGCVTLFFGWLDARSRSRIMLRAVEESLGQVAMF